jgi:hypothetical protein
MMVATTMGNAHFIRALRHRASDRNSIDTMLAHQVAAAHRAAMHVLGFILGLDGQDHWPVHAGRPGGSFPTARLASWTLRSIQGE